MLRMWSRCTGHECQSVILVILMGMIWVVLLSDPPTLISLRLSLRRVVVIDHNRKRLGLHLFRFDVKVVEDFNEVVNDVLLLKGNFHSLGCGH